MPPRPYPNPSRDRTPRTIMPADDSSPLLTTMIGHVVVVDLSSTYVCLGTLVGLDHEFLEIHDADLHDFRDNPKTREVYVYDSVRIGIRRNRARVLVRRREVVAVTRFDEVAAS